MPPVLIQCQQLQRHLDCQLSTQEQFSGSPLLRHQRNLILTDGVYKQKARVKAGTGAPVGFCPWQGLISLHEQDDGRDEENNTRCYSVS